MSGQSSAFSAGRQHPKFRTGIDMGNGPNLPLHRSGSAGIGKESMQVRDLSDIFLGVKGVGRVEQLGGKPVPAGSTSQAQIDTTGVKGFQQTEVFRHLQGTMVRQHNTTRPKTY